MLQGLGVTNIIASHTASSLHTRPFSPFSRNRLPLEVWNPLQRKSSAVSEKKMNYRNNRVTLACCGWKVIPYQYRAPITTLTCHLDYTLFNPRRKFPLKQEITPYLTDLRSDWSSRKKLINIGTKAKFTGRQVAVENLVKKT